MAKRKNEAEKAEGQRKKRVPFRAPKAATKAVLDPDYREVSSYRSLTRASRTLQNATASPLLRLLPLEIRRKIYTEVLGHRLIHLKYLHDDDCESRSDASSIPFDVERKAVVAQNHWSLLVCDPDGPRSKEESKLVDLLPKGLSSLNWQLCNRNLGLGSLFPRNVPFEEQDGRMYHREMHLGLLRTCRQVYTEANQILWSTNTFSFNDATTFERFMETRDSFQRRTVQKLRLVIHWTFEGEREWNPAIRLPLIRSLQRLRRLELLIGHEMDTESYSKFKNGHGLDAPLETRFAEFLRKLSVLPLNSVHVKVVSEDMHPAGPLVSLWTEEDQLESANVLRARLMNPDSADNHIRVQQELIEKQHRCASTLG